MENMNCPDATYMLDRGSGYERLKYRENREWEALLLMRVFWYAMALTFSSYKCSSGLAIVHPLRASLKSQYNTKETMPQPQ